MPRHRDLLGWEPTNCPHGIHDHDAKYAVRNVTEELRLPRVAENRQKMANWLGVSPLARDQRFEGAKKSSISRQNHVVTEGRTAQTAHDTASFQHDQ